MAIVPPALDDRNFDDLVDELLSKIPAHTPEWTDPRIGDPGRTLIELFAWLTDTLLYRVNLVPERQRIAFMHLVGRRLRPARAARGIMAVSIDDNTVTDSTTILPSARISGPATFESRSEVTIMPVTARAYYKRALGADERASMVDVLTGLVELYGLTDIPQPYVTTPVFPDGVADTSGFDLVSATVDRALWVALLAADATMVDAVRDTLGGVDRPQQQLLNVGVAPTIQEQQPLEDVTRRAPIPHEWDISAGVDSQGAPRYVPLDKVGDSTDGLTRTGVVRLVLPGRDHIAAPPNDVRTMVTAGVGDNPPRLDDEEDAARLVAWLRLRPTVRMESMSLSWVGINAVEFDQRETIRGRVVGTSSGNADQEFRLASTPGASVEAETLTIHVEEEERGFQEWTQVDDLAISSRDSAVYSLDAEAGTIGFGDGVRGRIPDAGRRIRVDSMRVGGGSAGNLPPGSLTKIEGTTPDGRPVANLKAMQPLATDGGEDVETLDEGLKRIPEFLRHRNRAVTESDIRQLASRTPGVSVGRVEVLPRFKPHQRRSNVPGVVSVMVLPFKEGYTPPNPRPDRPFIESVSQYLDVRRPVTTEQYVIGCEYVPLGLSIAITIRNGAGMVEVSHDVRAAIRRYLWPLHPGGPDQTGWSLGRFVNDRELEVIIAQVAGVSTVPGVNLFVRNGDAWEIISRARPSDSVDLVLEPWQLPELLDVVVVVGEDPPPEGLGGTPDPFGGEGGTPVPVVPEIC